MIFGVYFILILLIPLLAQMKVKSAYNKYSNIQVSTGLTGAEVARKILDENDLFHVKVEEIQGYLSDHYDPRDKAVRLSSDNFHGNHVAGIAVAAHEVGHAIQDKEGYSYLRMRHALVPVANFGSNISWILIMIGLLASISNLLLLGIILMFAAVLFQIVTLPVEFNASSRAKNLIVSLGMIQNSEEDSVKKVLNAAALTYVAGALVAVLELVRLIFSFIGMNNED